MKIVHFSDWHKQTMLLPKADLYICTGDMLPNFPILQIRRWNPSLLQDRIFYWDAVGPTVDPEIPFKPRPKGEVESRLIIKEREARLQELWIKQLGGYRQFMASPEAPVVVVRGNHDFTDLAPAFEGGPVFEINLDPTRTIEIGGLKIGGFRGIPFIRGTWSDELQRGKLPGMVDRSDILEPTDLETICEQLPKDLDIVVSHTPAYGILDNYGVPLGSEALMTYFNRRNYEGPKPVRAHCFGHIHESHRTVTLGDTIFSNAATGFNTFEI